MDLLKNSLIVLLLASNVLIGQKFKSVSSEVSFFSEAPLEDITAKSTALKMAVNNEDSTFAILIKMNSFDFPSDLMEEHYNENYLETEKYPNCTFLGKLSKPIQLGKDGAYPISATGKLTLHGVTKVVTLKGIATVKNGKLEITTDFQIKLEDYNIDIPTIVIKNIAEIIDVKAKVVLEPKK